MEEKDKKLEAILEKQVKISKPLSDKIVADIKNPRYTSGKLIKYGDIVLHVLEIYPNTTDFKVVIPENADVDTRVVPSDIFKLNKSQPTYGIFGNDFSLRMLILEQEEIDYYSRNYIYVGGSENATHVIKKPE